MAVRGLRCVAVLVLAILGRAALAGPADDVRPMVGTGADGHTFPGPTYPFGMVQLSPDTGSLGFDHCAGYNYRDTSIQGFSHTHLSGTGVGDLGDILVMPTVGDARAQLAVPATQPAATLTSTTRTAAAPERQPGYASAFSHDQEWASPGYYKVVLKDYNITAELTATPHAGFHKYTFPASNQAHIMIDLVHQIYTSTVLDSMLTVENSTTVSGYRRGRGWAQNHIVYFVMQVSRPFDGFGIQSGDAEAVAAREVRGLAVRAHLDFKTAAGAVIQLKVGLSPTSVEEARRNLAAELPSWDFVGAEAAANKAWNDALSVIDIDTPDPAIRQVFYTSLYHAMMHPSLYNDVDGKYTGADGAVHEATWGGQYYSTFSLWDTFRAEHPLLTLAAPERVNDFVNTMLAHSEQFGPHTLPMWTLASNETWCMIGYHSVPVITDAYLKGFRGYDVDKVYAAMRRTAMENRSNLGEYQLRGYVASPAGGGRGASNGGNSCVSRTLEYAYDDWCMAQMARALGKTDDAALFAKRAQNFRNVFNPETKFMQGRLASGEFRTPFNPLAYTADFTEANAWHYLWFVPHDGRALVGLLGGDAAFTEKLDQLFTLPGAGRVTADRVPEGIGQYWHGNEPVHQAPYMYHYAGAPYKSAEHARAIMTKLYANTSGGICGNDDCGQMSAWYVLSAMGFYPVNPAEQIYEIGSPLLNRATIHLNPKYYPNAKGGAFTIRAENNSPSHMYVQSATLNGQPLTRSYFTHAELAAGGELLLQMSDKPNLEWGKAEADRPPSMTAPEVVRAAPAGGRLRVRRLRRAGARRRVSARSHGRCLW